MEYSTTRPYATNVYFWLKCCHLITKHDFRYFFSFSPETDLCRHFKIEVVLRGHVTPLFTGIRRNMEDTAGSNPQSLGFTEKLKSWLSWSWTYVCFIWFGMVLIMIYVLWSPLKLQESLTSGELTQALASHC